MPTEKSGTNGTFSIISSVMAALVRAIASNERNTGKCHSLQTALRYRTAHPFLTCWEQRRPHRLSHSAIASRLTKRSPDCGPENLGTSLLSPGSMLQNKGRLVRLELTHRLIILGIQRNQRDSCFCLPGRYMLLRTTPP